MKNKPPESRKPGGLLARALLPSLEVESACYMVPRSNPVRVRPILIPAD